jgi:hypothetical protein
MTSGSTEHYKPGICVCTHRESKHVKIEKVRSCEVRGCKCKNYEGAK